MNYFNQGYMNYPYQYVQTPQPQQFMSQPLPLQTQQPQLNGKIVDSIDMVKVTEVPSNGYGVFPKADLSEIYIKSWNNNGTTNILTFKPVVSELPKKDEMTQLFEKINILENKIDSLITTPVIHKKEAKANEY